VSPGTTAGSSLLLCIRYPNWSRYPLSRASYTWRARWANMAAVGLSDSFRPDIARFPTMVVGDQTSSLRSESTQNLAALAQAARLPNSTSTQARIPATASPATPPPSISRRNSATRSRAPSQSKLSSTLNASPSRDTAPRTVTQEQGTTTATDESSHADSPGQGTPAVPPSPRLEPTQRSVLSFTGSGSASPSCIKVRDLSHIQSFASEEVLTRSRHGSSHSLNDRRVFGQKYEISAMPIADIIEMVAGLLTKITTTNDQQHERHIPPPDGTAGLSQQAASVLAFHGKNAPSITILSYLSRIHKYCPTTYEVFLSLLIYFDRMTELVNSGSLTVFGDERSTTTTKSRSSSGSPEAARPLTTSLSSSGQNVHDRDAALAGDINSPEADLSHFFVVDSYNIHRLVIAGVTSASKFFSDVFYTNSRYAKVRKVHPVYNWQRLILSQVGGLPLVELNHLELQFLLLNDFRLSVPVEELEAYGTMLVEFYAREVISAQQGGQTGDALYMKAPPAS